MSFAVHGDLANHALPTAIALCAIGSTHHRLDFLIGPGLALDPTRMRIIAIDAIGNGLTTSPSNSTKQPGLQFPRFSIKDMVRSQKLLLEHLGINKRVIVVGASMGGMQALRWGVDCQQAVKNIVALTPMAKTSAWAASVNDAARESLLRRLGDFDNSKSYAPDIWRGWIPIMQLLAMSNPKNVDAQFKDAAEMQAWLEARTTWWKTQRFDPIDWIYQSWAYDSHDVGASNLYEGDTRRALQSITAPTLIMTPALDLYNPIGSAQFAASCIPNCELHELTTDHGHLAASSADPESASQINLKIRRFLTGA